MADELERRRAQLLRDGASLRARHASALAMLADSSAGRAVRSEKPSVKDATQEDERETSQNARERSVLEEEEKVRAKLEKARERMTGPKMEIPTGREYDVPPNPAEEQVYDALEKAYNAAFCVPVGQVETQRSSDKGVFRQDEPQRSLLGAITATGDVQPAKKAAHPGSKETTAENAKHDASTEYVGTLKSMCLSTLKQQAEGRGQTGAKQSETKISNGARDESPPNPASSILDDPMTSPAVASGPNSTQSADDRESSPPSVPGSASAESVVSTLSAPQSPTSAHIYSGSKNSSTPSADVKAIDAESGETPFLERTDHLSLNEFLISELKVYCSRLLERRFSKNGPSPVTELAQFTAHRHYQDHQRALMDFDDEWKRSHSDSYQGFSNDTSSTEGPKVSMGANPFQRSTPDTSNTEGWDVVSAGVKASSAIHHSLPNSAQQSLDQANCADLMSAHKKGFNGVVVGNDSSHNERVQITAYLGQLAVLQNAPAFHVVITSSCDLQEWQNTLSGKLVQLYPYWGAKEDRQKLLQLLSNGYFSSFSPMAHVLLTSYEIFTEDLSILTSLQCQTTVIDIPGAVSTQVDPIWTQLLSVRCRQRLLLCQSVFPIDARRLLHFLVPELFESRRKLLAWSCAAFQDEQVHEICEVAKAFILSSDPERSGAFIAKMESCTGGKCQLERAALEKLDKQGIIRAAEPSIKIPVKRVLRRKPLSRASGYIPAKSKLVSQKLLTDPLPLEPPLSIEAPKILPQKRAGSEDSTPLSRKRIGRCGKCAGCLAEDCMKCGHCQDMKKYGGPGLRKQSCKNRKCLNPKIWGYASRKRRRSKAKHVDDHNESGDADSVRYESEMDDDGMYSSVESDRDSVSTGHGYGSDSESMRYSDATIDSPRDLLLPASDTFLEDNMSLSDLSSRSAKSRVVRCGECAGCHAADCMKCRYCLDMKKYGGPGLRKQSCKNRKCIAPKIVMLNQGKGDQYVDEEGNVVYSKQEGDSFPGFYEESDLSADAGTGAEVLSVIRECELFVEPQLAFACTQCTARFSSRLLLSFHTRVEHSVSPPKDTDTPKPLEQEASKLLMHPMYQNAMLSVQLKQQDKTLGSSPLGYAKLEGRDFHYYLIEPFVVLGRMNLGWRELYKELGFQSLTGLAGGDVGCHIGNDAMIANTHAVISWDAFQGSFVIECLSLRTPISVNGQEVSFSSSPVALCSRNLVQIGASVFYFLLPTSAASAPAATAMETTAQ